ncbi:hypothetical protein SmJEL517_g02111 [Synchytrium microbalum]|uniref:Elongation factor methyltransferase 6 n=1 Tax=Synchytrium microbalum TaxID=1806994 RepID=A0A507CD73_9FUNG|nr:uncharacterized protein SmJEL517_g02111 [Synchytrium microbalum]TPX35505.1 hypothetical protein SmJEL517_g02111 [Synchytrium microbalum]
MTIDRSPSPELNPLDVDLAPDQEVSRIGTSSTVKLFNIDRELHIAEDASGGCGGKTWEAASMLSDYVCSRDASYWEHRTKIIELGAGTGVVGFTIACVLEHHQTPSSSKVDITDLPVMVPVMELNATKNLSSSELCRMHIGDLSWGEPLGEEYTRSKPFDLVLCADCVYLEAAFEPLIRTLLELSDAHTEILICSKKRRRADKRFFTMLRKQFVVKDKATQEMASLYFSPQRKHSQATVK